jgi:hypothetical protein
LRRFGRRAGLHAAAHEARNLSLHQQQLLERALP